MFISENGEMPGIVLVFIAVFIFLLVLLPLISVFDYIKKNRAKLLKQEEARRMVPYNETTPTLDNSKTTTYEVNGSVRERLEKRLGAILPNIASQTQKSSTSIPPKQRSAISPPKKAAVKDNLTSTIKPHAHVEGEIGGDAFGTMDYCEFDDFFAGSSIGDIKEDEEYATVEVDIDFSKEGLLPEYAGEYIIFGDILNNPRYKTMKR